MLCERPSSKSSPPNAGAIWTTPAPSERETKSAGMTCLTVLRASSLSSFCSKPDSLNRETSISIALADIRAHKLNRLKNYQEQNQEENSLHPR